MKTGLFSKSSTVVRTTLLVAILLQSPGLAASPNVVVGQIGLSFYAVTGAVVQEVLRQLGHEVEVREGSHEKIFPLLAGGEIDLLVAAWLPGAHGHYWAQHSQHATELAVLYDDARLVWAVPQYVPESVVSSVGDLTRPDVVSRMNMVVQGTGPGSGLMRRSSRMMDEYGLSQAGYELLPGSQEEWLGAIRSTFTSRQWAIIPMSQPRFLSKAYELRVLGEPRQLLGESNRAVLVAHRGFGEKFGRRTTQVLGRIELGLDAVAEMDYLVNVDGLSPKSAALRWIQANRARVDGWLSSPD